MNYTIRPIGPEDAEGAAALRRMPGVFENTLGLPSYRTADSEAFIAGLGPDDHNFVAVLDDGTVIGCAGLTVCSNPRMRHVGAVGLFVHADYQGRGVGTTLMETLLDLADHWLMLVRVELEVFADNERAIRLYEKLGFEQEGLLRMTTVRTDCQGQGIGTALLEAVLDLADNWLMLHRVELEVYADNGDAIRLYQRFGFETEGRKREAAVKAGDYVDMLVMARLGNR